MYYYIFDLDNTLVYTNKLNNESYNYALQKLGYTINKNTTGRLTRKKVTSIYNIPNEKHTHLIDTKQTYFINNINKTVLNKTLFKKLKSLNPKNCILWTSAEYIRVEAILKHYNLSNYFSWVFYSKKDNMYKDITTICKYFNCNKDKLLFFENNNKIKKLINTTLQQFE